MFDSHILRVNFRDQALSLIYFEAKQFSCGSLVLTPVS
jgi:hypothetical protein